ncbi:MAG: sigma-70 family RNA polymerase sigma factor [Deltaproteobacteria bacterium]|nr:sigma-70 family RNA polymerase sigma factor [Deltaproteobacteria bacterium]
MDDAANDMLDRIARPKLGPDELVAAVARAQRGDARAREEVIRSCSRFVGTRARRKRWLFHGREDDALSIGLVGLNRAIDAFDTTAGTSFINYARWSIDGTLLKVGRRGAALVSIPGRHDLEQLFKQLDGNESLDAPLVEDKPNGATRIDGLAADGATPEDAYLAEEAKQSVNQLIDRLPDRMRTVIRARFIDGKSLSEIGSWMGMNQDQARKLETAALQRLAKLAHSDKTPAEIREAVALPPVRDFVGGASPAQQEHQMQIDEPTSPASTAANESPAPEPKRVKRCGGVCSRCPNQIGRESRTGLCRDCWRSKMGAQLTANGGRMPKKPGPKPKTARQKPVLFDVSALSDEDLAACVAEAAKRAREAEQRAADLKSMLKRAGAA